MKEIPLTKGQVAIVDDEDYEWLSQFTWRFVARRQRSPAYATRVVKLVTGKQATVLMHRLILGLTPQDKLQVDHINHIGTDNRRCNLRIATYSQNQANRGAGCNNKAGYKGVHIRDNKWRSTIQFNWKTIHLGTFNTPEQAAMAYNEAAIKYFGEYACLNEIREPLNDRAS